MSINEKTSHLVALLGLSVALSLAGCGGGGGGGTDSPTVAADALPEPAASSPEADSGPPSPDPVVADKQTADVASAQADSEAVDTALSAAETQNPDVLPVAPAQVPSVQALAVPTASVTATTPPSVTSFDIFVATNGNDAWSGRVATANAGLTDGPVRTIAAAQTIARQRLAAMAAGATRQPINVRIAAGEYRLTAPLSFGPHDSGVPEAPVTYSAAQAGTVTISGAAVLGSVVAGAAGSTLAIPGPAADPLAMRGGTQLFVNGRRATLARTPNSGNFWFVQKPLNVAGEPVGQEGREAFVAPAEALTVVNGLSAADRSRAMVKVMQAWTSGRHRLSSLASPSGGVRVTPRAPWAFLNFGVDQRFYIENIPTALDAPGEWIWDGTNVRYLATAADAGQTVKFEMPMLERLVVIQGVEKTTTWVQDLQFQGLTFANTRQLTPDVGFIDRQAAIDIGAAVEVDAARRIKFENCTFTRTGGYAVWFRNAVRDSRVDSSSMLDLGAGGVKIGLTTQSPDYLAGTRRNVLHANQIKDTGKLFPGAVGVWIGQSFDNTVSNNLISNTTYTAISVGWAWQYGIATSGRNSIINNLLLNVGQGELSDVGGVYTLGDSPGTIISGNVIQQVRPYPGYGPGGWGLYNDQATTGVLMEKNIVVGTSNGGYLMHYGRDNTLRSNILAFGDRSELAIAISDPNKTKLVTSDNLLIPNVTMPFQWFATTPDVQYANNRVSTSKLTAALDLTKCNGGCTAVTTGLSVGADPRNITLSSADAATNAWVAEVTSKVGPPRAVTAALPPVPTVAPPAVVAPPVSFELDIAGTAIGAQPPKMIYRAGTNPAAISVVGGAATPSGKCLQFADMANNRYTFEPYSWSILNHTVGTTTVEFSILIDANTKFIHDWRDDATTFLTGPSLNISASRGVEVGGKTIAPATVGQWMTLKITAGVGAAAGTWHLQITNAAGVTTSFPNLALRNNNWKRLNWLGFISNSVVASNLCLGVVKISNPGT